MKLSISERVMAWLASSDMRSAHKRFGKMVTRGVGTSYALSDSYGVSIYTSYPKEVEELKKFILTMGDPGGNNAE